MLFMYLFIDCSVYVVANVDELPGPGFGINYM